MTDAEKLEAAVEALWRIAALPSPNGPAADAALAALDRIGRVRLPDAEEVLAEIAAREGQAKGKDHGTVYVPMEEVMRQLGVTEDELREARG